MKSHRLSLAGDGSGLVDANHLVEDKTLATEQNFTKFVDQLLAARFDLFLDLEYPAPIPCEDIAKHQAKALLAARSFAAEVTLKKGSRSCARLIVTESRSDGSFLFHVFFAGCEWTKVDNRRWLHKWWLQHLGGARRRRLKTAQLGGLLRYLVMQAGCSIDALAPDLGGTYCRDDFW
jgi:hypothetical protein